MIVITKSGSVDPLFVMTGIPRMAWLYPRTIVLWLTLNLTAVVTVNSIVVLPDVGLDLSVRVDKFLQEGSERTQVEVADYWVGRVGYYNSYFWWTAHGVAEFTASGKSPCVFADGKEEELEPQAMRQERNQFLKNAGNPDFQKVSGCTFP